MRFYPDMHDPEKRAKLRAKFVAEVGEVFGEVFDECVKEYLDTNGKEEKHLAEELPDNTPGPIIEATPNQVAWVRKYAGLIAGISPFTIEHVLEHAQHHADALAKIQQKGHSCDDPECSLDRVLQCFPQPDYDTPCRAETQVEQDFPHGKHQVPPMPAPPTDASK